MLEICEATRLYSIMLENPDATKGQTVSILRAAKILGVGKGQMYAAVKKGQIPTIAVNNRDRVPLPWIEAKLRGE
jgi:hypothetical protein